MENETDNNRFKLSFLGAIVIIFVYYILIAGIINLPFSIFSETTFIKKSEILQAAVIVIGDVISYILAIKLILRKIKKKNTIEFKLSFIDKFNFKLLLCSLLLIVGYYLWFQSSFGILIQKIPLPQFIENAFESLAVNDYSLVATVAIIAPIFEEVIMRGIVLEGFLNKYKPVTAIILSAFIFGVMHLNIPQFINTAIIGIILGVIYYKTKSLLLCIYVHALNNIIAICSGIISFKFNIFIFLFGMLIFVLAGTYLLKHICNFKNLGKMEVEEAGIKE